MISDNIVITSHQTFLRLYGTLNIEDPRMAFRMMDVNGVDRVNAKDAPQMILDLKLIDDDNEQGAAVLHFLLDKMELEDDGIRFVESNDKVPFSGLKEAANSLLNEI